MASEKADLDAGLAAFGALLEAEYGRPIAHYAGGGRWGDLETAQISRALEILIKLPIADLMPLPRDADSVGEAGSKRRWILSDQKIAGAEFEATWQWRLLAAIDNATRSDEGRMMTPSDPRMFLLRRRYERDFLAPLAAHFLKYLCGRTSFPVIPGEPSSPEISPDQAERLRKIPGLEDAGAAFIAGTLFMLAAMGMRAFCDWCDERG